jgi:hypothetical protein
MKAPFELGDVVQIIDEETGMKGCICIVTWVNRHNLRTIGVLFTHPVSGADPDFTTFYQQFNVESLMKLGHIRVPLISRSSVMGDHVHVEP